MATIRNARLMERVTAARQLVRHDNAREHWLEWDEPWADPRGGEPWKARRLSLGYTYEPVPGAFRAESEELPVWRSDPYDSREQALDELLCVVLRGKRRAKDVAEQDFRTLVEVLAAIEDAPRAKARTG